MPTQQTYAFTSTPRLARLRASVTARDGRVHVRTAAGAPLAQRAFLRLFFGFLNGVPPITSIDGRYVHSLYVPPTPSTANRRVVEAFLRRTLLGQPTPMAVTIAVTDACQCSCGHCSAGRGRTTARTADGLVTAAGPAAAGKAVARGTGRAVPLSFQELRRVVEGCLDLGVGNVTFTGGEPLLRADLEELIAGVDPERATVQIFTNGLLLDERRAAALKEAGLHAVHVSLDSPDPRRHDALRGAPGASAAVRRAIAAARSAGLLVGLSTYATNRSIERRELSRIARLALEWDVHEVSVFDVIPTGRLLDSRSSLLTSLSHRRLLREAACLNRRLGGRPRVTTQTWTNSSRGVAWFIGCLAWNWQFHVNAYGEATPCDFTPLTFGNVRERALDEIWRDATAHPEWGRRRRTCRMQSASFRERYIDTIPCDASLPYPIRRLEA
jgi:MoaA/NifB/PqqE/SkfB family radical SAM enzyme